MYKNIYVQILVFDFVFFEIEEWVLQLRFGYFWYCLLCDYESCWYFFYLIVVVFVVIYVQKYDGYYFVIYEVQV